MALFFKEIALFLSYLKAIGCDYYFSSKTVGEHPAKVLLFLVCCNETAL